MKVILTGVTGFIGGEVLSYCLRVPEITSVITLSRRQLPKHLTQNPKLDSVIMEDFNKYPDSVLEKLSGADACIWCMGTTAGNRTLEVDYPLAFAQAICKTFADRQQTFRYVHLSGAATERDQSKSLWIKGEMRKMKGEAEQNMLNFSKEEGTRGYWQTVIVKSGFVITKDGVSPRDMMGWMMGAKNAIRVNELAAALTYYGLEGNNQGTVDDNEEVARLGREFLSKVKG